MEFLLWVIAWILTGSSVALIFGAAASLSDVPVDQHSSHDAVGNSDHLWLDERGRDDAANELNAAIGTDRRRRRSM